MTAQNRLSRARLCFPILLWSRVIFASFWSHGGALRGATAEDFHQKNSCRLLHFEVVTI